MDIGEQRTVQIDNRHIRPTQMQRLAHHEAQPSRAARHQPNLILEGESRQRAAEMETAPALDGRRARHVRLIRVFEGEAFVGSGEAAFVL